MDEPDYVEVYEKVRNDMLSELVIHGEEPTEEESVEAHAAALRVVAWTARQHLKLEIAIMATESPTRTADLTELLFGSVAKPPLKWKFTLRYTRIYQRKEPK